VRNRNLLNGNVHRVSRAWREKLAFVANHHEGSFESSKGLTKVKLCINADNLGRA
jgi:hypothetical protein